MIKNRRTYEIMNPADIGAPPSKLILTARSGRRALIARLENLGVRVREDRFDEIYERFKRVADRKRIVEDGDLKRDVIRGLKKSER
jgi:2-isopropylmalate synthase